MQKTLTLILAIPLLCCLAFLFWPFHDLHISLTQPPPHALIIDQQNTQQDTQTIVEFLHKQGWKDEQITILTNPTTNQLTEALHTATAVWYNGPKVEHTPKDPEGK